MEHKRLVAESLRRGLEKIKRACIESFQNNPLNEQWWYLERKLTCDIDFHEHKKIVEDNFAYDSRSLLRRVQGD